MANTWYVSITLGAKRNYLVCRYEDGSQDSVGNIAMYNTKPSHIVARNSSIETNQ